jgi:hypothetical protein
MAGLIAVEAARMSRPMTKLMQGRAVKIDLLEEYLLRGNWMRSADGM